MLPVNGGRSDKNGFDYHLLFKFLMHHFKGQQDASICEKTFSALEADEHLLRRTEEKRCFTYWLQTDSAIYVDNEYTNIHLQTDI